MVLNIRLNEGKTMKDVANKVVQFNTIAAPLLVNGPINANPLSDTSEGFFDCSTPVNSERYAAIMINNYRKLFLKSDMLAFFSDTFEIVAGEPVEDVVDAEGNVTQVYGGVFA